MRKKPSCWDVFAAVVFHLNRLLLFGPSGTGKTYQACRAGLHPGQAMYAITLTEDTSAAELRGHYVPKDGQFVWEDGPVLRAWRRGARLVLNEIDHAGADAQTQLHVFLDDPETAELTLPTGEIVRPAAGFSVIATMNGRVVDLPEALQDRFPVAIHVDSAHPAAIAGLPADLQQVARNTVVLEGERRVSVRKWQAFAKLREVAGDDLAAYAVFDERAGDVQDALRLKRA